jgi:hypothetical protein
MKHVDFRISSLTGLSERGKMEAFLDSSRGPFYNRIEVERLANKHLRKKWSFIFIMLILLLFALTQSGRGQESKLKLRVVAEQANIRLEPDIASIIIRQLSQGTILESAGKEGEWYAVEFTSKEGTTVSGYVHESLVVVIEPPPEKKELPQKIQEEEQKTEVMPEPLDKKKPQISPPPEIEVEISQQKTPQRFHCTIFAGGNYSAGGDLNQGSLGFADFYGSVLGIPGTRDVKPVHYGFSFGGEISISLTSRLSLGLGIESIRGKKENLVDFSQVMQTHILKIRPELSAIPAGIFVSYSIIPDLYIKGGFSYYFANCSYFYQIQDQEQSQEWKGEASAQGLGLQGGLGFTWSFTPRLRLVVELVGHYAKIDGFQGKDTFQSNSGQTLVEEGTLYLLQAEVSEQQSYPLLFIRESKPHEAGVIDAREAQIDFSGVSLKIGLRFHL